MVKVTVMVRKRQGGGQYRCASGVGAEIARWWCRLGCAGWTTGRALYEKRGELRRIAVFLRWWYRIECMLRESWEQEQ